MRFAIQCRQLTPVLSLFVHPPVQSMVHLVDSNLWPNLTLTPFTSIDDIFLDPATSDTVMFPQVGREVTQ